MAAIGSLSGTSSAVDSISDLDGYTITDYNFPASNNFGTLQEDDFGFDPPQLKPSSQSNYQVYSPPDDLSMPEWPGFEHDEDLKQSNEGRLDLDAYEIDKYINASLPDVNTAVARFGQMTPPRSNSTASTDSKSEDKLSPKSGPPERRKRSKTQTKEAETTATSTTTTATPGRKRKSSKKSLSTASDKDDRVEEQKRKQSLEKNRLAAAKCRINKKEKTEQLQRDSHEKAIQNAYLKDQVMRMKDEIQQMNALILAHANCEGCKSPQGIQTHLNNLGNDFFTQQMSLAAPSFNDYPAMDFSAVPAVDNFFTGASPNHPPLPEFNRPADFEVHTPMQTD
jgi:hypothetical protein